ncbi:MAG: YbjN domain-containing protein [Pseudomonadota bacterium]
MSRFLVAICFVFGLAGAAHGAEILDAGDPNEIHQIASGFGAAELATSNDGDPLIRGRMSGVRYIVLFYGCTDGVNCRTIQFYTAFQKQVTDEKMNDWNRTKRFGRAYRDNEGDAVIEMDVNLFGGVTKKNLDDTFDYYRLVLDEFTSFIELR